MSGGGWVSGGGWLSGGGCLRKIEFNYGLFVCLSVLFTGWAKMSNKDMISTTVFIEDRSYIFLMTSNGGLILEEIRYAGPFLFACLSVGLSVRFCVCLSVCLFVCLSVCMFTYT